MKKAGLHAQVIENVVEKALTLSYAIKGLTFSSIKGPAGNIEYLLWITTEPSTPFDLKTIPEIVDTAFATLN